MRKKIILTISHDIRAPLSIINGSAELAMDMRDRKKRNGHLANIGVLCKHILHLLNNLLDVYRLNEAKETRHDIPFRLSGLLERIAAGFTHTANDKGLQCKKKYSSEYQYFNFRYSTRILFRSRFCPSVSYNPLRKGKETMKYKLDNPEQYGLPYIDGR